MIEKMVSNRAMCRLSFLLTLLALCLSLVLGMPDGAPLEACSTMTPKHSTNSPKPLDSSVHELQVFKSNNNNNNIEYQVTLVGKSGAENFRGFFIQARSSQGGSNQVALGTWDISQASRVAKLVGCAPGNVASAVTHADNTDKNRVVLKWIPPTGFVGNVAFVATVVEKFTSYWVGIQSEMVSLGSTNVNNNNIPSGLNNNNNNNQNSGFLTPSSNNGNGLNNDVHSNLNPLTSANQQHASSETRNNHLNQNSPNSNNNPNGNGGNSNNNNNPGSNSNNSPSGNSNTPSNNNNSNSNNIRSSGNNSNTRMGNSKILEGAFGGNNSVSSGNNNGQQSPGVNKPDGSHSQSSSKQALSHPTPYPKGLSGKGNLSKMSASKNSTSAKSGSASLTGLKTSTLVVAIVAFSIFRCFLILNNGKIHHLD